MYLHYFKFQISVTELVSLVTYINLVFKLQVVSSAILYAGDTVIFLTILFGTSFVTKSGNATVKKY